MTNLFIADNYMTAVDTAMDVLPPSAKQMTITVDLETRTALVVDVSTRDPEYMMKTPPVASTNTTGIRGVSKVHSGYRADITRAGKQTYLGTYDSLQDAVEARLVAQWGLV